VFAALGFFAPLRFAALASVPRILALAAGCSILVEVAQYVLRLDRVSSVDDVLLNAAGAGLAALASRPWWRGPSVETELVALDVLHHEARLVVGVGQQQSHADRAEREQSRAFGLQRGQALLTDEPGADPHVKVQPFLTTLPSGTRWKYSRGPTPDGSTQANPEPCFSGGRARSNSSHVAKPFGGDAGTYPNTSHQKRATRTGSAQSKVTWNCLTDAIAPP
jgi:hypothetical protein